MMTLLKILARILFHPTKYGLTSISLTDGQIGVFCGKKKQIEDFEKLIEETHKKHIENSVVDKS